ncbi:MAG: NACHT domain-containing protein [Pseudomonadota bacterium]
MDFFEPTNWGADLYRDAIAGRAVVSIPGTRFNKSIGDDFPWPDCTGFDEAKEPDFDEEAISVFHEVQSTSVDIRQFPSVNFDRVVLIGGAGLGKSVLTKAIAARLANLGKLPATVVVPDFSRSNLSIADYLQNHINADYRVSIDWQHACEKGRVVLILDGLDEVAPEQRQIALERLSVFSARHPSVPWLLTVRDATALNLPINGTLIEINPLGANGIREMISFYRPEDASALEQYVELFEAKPDLFRLARIPLFLALLAVTNDHFEDMPISRSEVLETYLAILMRPGAHKPSDKATLATGEFRRIAEWIAFDALERDQIGVGPLQIQRAIDDLGLDYDTDSVTDAFVKCGLLKRSSLTRLVFPFPIIQEYFAGCRLATRPVQLIFAQLDLVIKRPWAQALQFALEQHPEPERIAQSILDNSDDAFSTKLRLLARCISNGMSCSDDAKAEVTDRIAKLWTSSSWQTQKRIGEMIADTFCHPLRDSVRQRLANRHLIHSGLGKVVSAVDDDDLTERVIRKLVTSTKKQLLNLSDLQEPVNRISETAFDFYIEQSMRATADDEEADDLETMISCLIGHLDTSSVPQTKIIAAARNPGLSLAVRLAAFLKSGLPIDQEFESLLEDALAVDSWQRRSSAIKIISRQDDAADRFRHILTDPKWNSKDREKLLDSIPCADHPALLLDLYRSEEIEECLRLRSLVFAARYGDQKAMEQLVTDIELNPSEIVAATISLFGHYRSESLASRSAQAIACRGWTLDERRSLASGVRTGMTTIFQMDSFECGTLEYCPRHPGAVHFEGLLESWSGDPGFSTLEALSYDLCLAELGYGEADSRILNRVEDVLRANDVDLIDWENAHTLGGGLRYLRKKSRIPSISFLEKAIQKSSHNAVMYCYDMLADIGTYDALDSLLSAYNNNENQARNLAYDALERLSGRLGVRIEDRSGELVIDA